MSPDFIWPFFAGVGTLFAVVGVRTLLDRRRFLRTAVQVPGVVTALRAHRSSSGDSGPSVTYHPVLRFTTVDGRLVETESRFGSNPPPARPGTWLPVLYDPADPADARLTGAMGGGVFLGVLFTALGSLFALIGVAGLVVRL